MALYCTCWDDTIIPMNRQYGHLYIAYNQGGSSRPRRHWRRWGRWRGLCSKILGEVSSLQIEFSHETRWWRWASGLVVRLDCYTPRSCHNWALGQCHVDCCPHYSLESCLPPRLYWARFDFHRLPWPSVVRRTKCRFFGLRRCRQFVSSFQLHQIRPL